jgi:hypothetical protein
MVWRDKSMRLSAAPQVRDTCLSPASCLAPSSYMLVPLIRAGCSAVEHPMPRCLPPAQRHACITTHIWSRLVLWHSSLLRARSLSTNNTATLQTPIPTYYICIICIISKPDSFANCISRIWFSSLHQPWADWRLKSRCIEEASAPAHAAPAPSISHLHRSRHKR